MRKFYYICLFILLSICFNEAKATHIVGGELTYVLIDTTTYTYKITLKLYRDCLGAAYDANAIIAVYDTSGVLIKKLLAPFPGATTIDPNPASDPCLIIPNICVEEAIYVITTDLPPIQGGYNLVYQRCCRRFDIVNITTPGAVGLTLLTPVLDTGIVKYNSNPIFTDFPPLAICVNEDISFDHSATDADGDSLVYSLCTPFEGGGNSFGSSCPTCPIPDPPLPPPHSFVNWIPPFFDQDPLGGIPLDIDSMTGLLTGKPNQIGKFVVGVCVTEYRDDSILSVNKRDFQFNVVQCLNPSAAVFDFERICGDLTVSFPDSSTGASSYWWDFGDPNTTSDTSISNAPTYVYLDTGVFQVTLIVNKSSACSDTAQGILELRPGIHPNYNFNGICIADSIHFIDSSFVDAGNLVSWHWDFNDGDTANELTPVHYYTNPDTYQVQLTVISNFLCVDSITKTVIVDTFTIADIGPDFSLCGDSIILFDNFSKGAKKYFWNFGDPLVFNDTSNIYKPTYTYLDTGFFQVMLITNSACNSDTDYMNLGVLDGVSADFNFNSVCLGNTTVFVNTSNSNSSDSIINYEWDFGNGDNSFVKDTSYLYLDDSTYQVKLSIASSLGCEDSISKSVVVYGLPKAILPGILSFCGINNPISFIDSSINSDSYHWDFGDPFTNADTSNIQTPNYTYPDSGFYTIRLITGAGGLCFDTTFNTIQIKPGANAQFDFDFVCLNDTVMLTNNSSVEAGQLISWEWDFGDGTNSSSQNPNQHFYDSSGNYLIQLIVTSDKNCKDTLDSIATVFDLPVYDLGNDTTVCYKSYLTFKLESSVTYYLGSQGCASSSSDVLSPIINNQFVMKILADTTLTVSACDTNSCGFTDQINILTNSLPIVIANPDYIEIDRGTEVQLNVTGANTYVWLPNSYINNPNIANPVVTTPVDTIYYVYGTDLNGCVNYDSVIIDVLLSPELDIPSAFTPDGDGLNDVFQYFYYDLKSLIYFRIYNRYGQKVFEGNGLGDSWNGKFKEKDQEVGTYVYYLSAETFDNKIIYRQGNIALIR